MTAAFDAVALAQRIGELTALPAGTEPPADAPLVIETLLAQLEAGNIRAAEGGPGRPWRAVPWVKQGILLAFRFGAVADLSPESGVFSFVDKATVPPRRIGPDAGIRIVPGGSTIRRGAHVAAGVVCMPPMFVNVGAWIGAGTMVDSHALVGSCAQVGERVHLSAAAQVGGVLEPVNASPVVIEDDVIVGGNCGVYEGTVVRRRAVLGAGVILTRGTPVFDLVNECVYKGTAAEPLEIPADAVVVPGARAVRTPWKPDLGISLQTPVIVKYRDDKTDLATALESWLR